VDYLLPINHKLVSITGGKRTSASAVLPVTGHSLYFAELFQCIEAFEGGEGLRNNEGLRSNDPCWRASVGCGWRERLAGLMWSSCSKLTLEAVSVDCPGRRTVHKSLTSLDRSALTCISKLVENL